MCGLKSDQREFAYAVVNATDHYSHTKYTNFSEKVLDCTLVRRNENDQITEV